MSPSFLGKHSPFGFDDFTNGVLHLPPDLEWDYKSEPTHPAFISQDGVSLFAHDDLKP
jgi:hypothetical protein